MKLLDAAKNKDFGMLRKLENYFSEYDFHFRDFQEKHIRLLEIGVQGGGSLSMWQIYFPKASIVGIDIDTTCKKFERENVKVYIGDQEDTDFLITVNKKEGPFDIIIDDGGHTMKQQITTFKTLFPKLNDGGIYVIEDLHTSYWGEFGGKIKRKNTMIGVLKDMIDDMHYWAINHPRAKLSSRIKKKLNFHINNFGFKIPIKNISLDPKSVTQESIKSLHIADSICFIYKGKTKRHNMFKL